MDQILKEAIELEVFLFNFKKNCIDEYVNQEIDSFNTIYTDTKKLIEQISIFTNLYTDQKSSSNPQKKEELNSKAKNLINNGEELYKKIENFKDQNPCHLSLFGHTELKQILNKSLHIEHLIRGRLNSFTNRYKQTSTNEVPKTINVQEHIESQELQIDKLIDKLSTMENQSYILANEISEQEQKINTLKANLLFAWILVFIFIIF